jgi:hypothetical protein
MTPCLGVRRHHGGCVFGWLVLRLGADFLNYMCKFEVRYITSKIHVLKSNLDEE